MLPDKRRTSTSTHVDFACFGLNLELNAIGIDDQGRVGMSEKGGPGGSNEQLVEWHHEGKFGGVRPA